MMNEPGLKQVDPVLCMSIQTKHKMEETMKEMLIPWRTYWKHGLPFATMEGSPRHAQKLAEDESYPISMDTFLGKGEEDGINKIDTMVAATKANN